MTRHIPRASKRRACDGKRKHANRGRAVTAIGSLIDAGAAEDALIPYRCRHCGCWHVGHRTRVNG